MKKLFYSLMTLAAALTVTSCLKEVEGGSAAYDDGTLVDATFSVVLGPQTKAFADGTTATNLFAGLYEVDDAVNPTTYKYVANSTVQSIDPQTKKGKVEFPAGLKRGRSYAVFFWAQASGAPYTIDWATGEGVITGPSVTVTTSGTGVVANDENRDAFTGTHLFGPVTESINTEDDPILLMRPFAQINILVPNENVDVLLNALADGERRSSMKVSGLPNKVFLATGATEGTVDYDFTMNNIMEPAFGTYANTHQYMAMNYVLFGAANTNYPVTFSVINKGQTADNKTVSVPIKANTRTNIVGDIFAEDFDYVGWVVVYDEPGELTQITVTTGQGADSEHAVVLTYNQDNPVWTTVGVVVNHKIQNDQDLPSFEYDPTGVAEAKWVIDDQDAGTGHIEVRPLVENGSTKITVTFPPVTKTSYAEASMDLYVKVGNGQNEELEQVAAPTFSPAAGAVEAGTEVTLATTTADATIQYKLGDGEYQNYKAAITITDAVTITAKATKEGMTDSDEVVAEYTIAAAPQPTKLGTPVLDEENAVAEESSITLVWDDIENATSYAVTYKVKDAAGEAAVVSPAPTTGGVSIENLDAETTYTITVQALADGFEASDVASIDLTTLATTPVVTSNIAKVLEQITSTNKDDPSSYSANLTGAVVTYVNGKYNYLEDASGAIVLFMENAGLTAGQTISGVISGTGYIYNGTPQITSIGEAFNAVAGGTIPKTTVTITDLLANYNSYLSRRIKLEGVTVTGGISGSDRDGTIEQSGASIAVRSQINNGPTLTENEIGDLITFPALYNSTKQVSLYETSQFTKTGVVPVLSALTSVTVNANVDSYTWSISSNTNWTIGTGEGVTASATSGNGNADVTLSFAKNTGMDAKTLTATVSASGCKDVTITITQNGVGEVTPISISVTPASITSSTAYDSYENDSWIMTCGSGNGTFGCNPKNADAKMMLGDHYAVATALDSNITADATHYAAMISKSKLDAGITTITLGGTIGTGMTVGVTISTDGTTWTKLADFGTTTTFSFAAQQSVYYAVVIKANNKSNATYTGFSATFSNE